MKTLVLGMGYIKNNFLDNDAMSWQMQEPYAEIYQQLCLACGYLRARGAHCDVPKASLSFGACRYSRSVAAVGIGARKICSQRAKSRRAFGRVQADQASGKSNKPNDSLNGMCKSIN